MRAVFICVAALLGVASAVAAPVTLDALLAEMDSLDHLTRMPVPFYTTLQCSSYDRRSTDPAVQTDENWYANRDRGEHIRNEERNGATEYVLMDAEGPGAIVRFWSADPLEGGTVRIYIDGAETPVIEVPLADMLAGNTPFTPNPIGGIRARGWNSYLPIPFAKHCKVTVSEPRIFYIINYRKYEAGAEVQSLTAEMLSAKQAEIAAVAARLATPRGANAQLTGTRELAHGKTFKTQQTRKAPTAITSMSMLVDAQDLETALRGLVLKIKFDGKETVAAPVGDFFATAPGLNPYRALPMGVSSAGLYALWPMPFRERFEISILNLSGATAGINLAFNTAPITWTEDTLYFHAKWRSALDIATHPRQDWNYATIHGRGRLVGAMLHMSNPVKEWWGEGDEKIYIDGATFPQWFGTGSEDFYGYAWCDNHTFTHAYHNQPRSDGPANYGHSCVSRFLIMDNIVFRNSLKFDMEVWHSKETTITQSAMAYWYADARATDNFEPIKRDWLKIPKLPKLPRPQSLPGAIEGEKMRILSVDGGLVMPQASDIWKWSASEQLWWMDAAPGNKLVLGFEAPEAAEKEVKAIFTRAPDYAIATISVNGKPGKENMDFYHPTVEPSGIFSLGRHQLKKGQNTLTLEITGRNEHAVPSHMLGVDCIFLE
jgi:hypothetical protein